MKLLMMSFSLAWVLAVSSCRKAEVGHSSSTALSVQFSDLLQRPKDYAGQLVRVRGFLRVEFEGKCLYVSEEAHARRDYDAGLWADVPLSMTDFDRHMVVIEATFEPSSHGHLGLWRKGSLIGMRYLAVVRTEPNQSSEPTPTSVTTPAAQEIAPAAVVAHL